MRFDRGLDKKRSLFRLQKYQFKVREKFPFCNGLSHDFGQKPENPSEFVLFQKGLGLTFYNVLVKKEVCLDYKNVTISRNIGIFNF